MGLANKKKFDPVWVSSWDQPDSRKTHHSSDSVTGAAVPNMSLYFCCTFGAGLSVDTRLVKTRDEQMNGVIQARTPLARQ